jgi:HTH-type transcriptional regulator/antitoxin HigA
MNSVRNFNPDRNSPPGTIILDFMLENSLTLKDVSNKLNMSEEKLKLLLKGDIIISENIAERLEKEIGSTKEFWSNREKQYRERNVKNN